MHSIFMTETKLTCKTQKYSYVLQKYSYYYQIGLNNVHL